MHAGKRRTGRQRAQLFGVQDIYAAVWLVFLLIPVAIIALFSDAGVWWDTAAYASIAIFAVTYVLLMRRTADYTLAFEGPLLPRVLRLLAHSAILIAILLPTLPSLGPNVFGIEPFFAAQWMWSLPFHAAMFAGVAWTACSAFAAIAWVGHPEFSLLIGITTSFIFLILFRFFSDRAVQQERLTTELATVREREEISRDVHDLLGHSLTVVVLKAQVARKLLRSNPDRAEAELDELLELSQDSLAEVRGVVGRMRTPDLASQVAAARTALEAAGVQLKVRGSLDEVPVECRALFAWAVREGCTNIARHAQAEHATIRFDGTRLDFTDDGVGQQAAEGHGLTGLRTRAEQAGATMRIHPANPANRDRPGTTLTVEFPQ